MNFKIILHTCVVACASTALLAACNDPAAPAAEDAATEASADEPTELQALALFPADAGASQSCLQVEGDLEVGSSVTLGDCDLATDLIFTSGEGGALGLATQDNLCLDLEAQGMGNETSLIVNECPAEGGGWTTTATALEAGAVRGPDGQCLVIPQMTEEGATFPFYVTTGDCAQSQQFYLSTGE